jgi:hypothetical protein
VKSKSLSYGSYNKDKDADISYNPSEPKEQSKRPSVREPLSKPASKKPSKAASRVGDRSIPNIVKDDTLVLDQSALKNDDEDPEEDWNKIMKSNFDDSKLKNGKDVGTPKSARRQLDPQSPTPLRGAGGGGEASPRFDQSAISYSEDQKFFSGNQSFVENSPYKKKRTRNLEDSALGVNALDDHDLSQIMNPKVQRILDNPKLNEIHQSTKKSNVFLKKNFLVLESLINKMRKRDKKHSFDAVKSYNNDGNRILKDIRKKLDQKKNKREGIRKLGALAKIYQKQHTARALEVWYETLERARTKEASKARLAQVFTVMASYKAKEFLRIALGKLRDLEIILEKDEEERKGREQKKEMERTRRERFLQLILGIVRRQVQNKKKDALYSMMQEALNPYGGSRRKNDYHKSAGLMLMAYIINKEVDKQKKQTLETLLDYQEHLKKFPDLLRIMDGLKKFRKTMPKLEQRVYGQQLMSVLKIKHNKRIRKGLSNMFEALVKYEKRTKLDVFRKIFTQNIGLLKYQKKITYFSGLFSRLVKSQKKRNLRIAFTQIYKTAQTKSIKMKNARILCLKLQKLFSQTKKEVFKKLNYVPAVQELFNFERDKYERSIKLRGALKIGNTFGNYYRRFLFEKVRKTMHYLRKFNHMYKIPAYNQRLNNFRYIFDDQRKRKLEEAFLRLKQRSTLYLLQRFFRDTIDLSAGLNPDIIFALENNVHSRNPKINQIVEFWNTTYDFEDAPVLLLLMD